MTVRARFVLLRWRSESRMKPNRAICRKRRPKTTQPDLVRVGVGTMIETFTASHCRSQAVPTMNEPPIRRIFGCQKYVPTATKSAIHVTTSLVELQGAESAVSNPLTQLTAAAVPILLLTYQISIHSKIFLKQTAMNSTLPRVPSSAPRFSAISRSAHHDPSGSPNRSKTVVSSPDAPLGSHSL